MVDVFGVGEPQPVRPLTVSCEILSRLCRYERRSQRGPSGNGWPGRTLLVGGERGGSRYTPGLALASLVDEAWASFVYLRGCFAV